MNIIRNVDLDRYSYLNLTEDIGQVSLSHLSSRVGLALTILCDVPRSNDKLLVESDEDILRMFEIHNSRKIKLYVDIMCSSLSQFGDVGMLPATLSLPITSAVHSGTTDCNDNMSNSGDIEDYSEGIYELSSEDDDLNMNRTNCGENIGKNNNDFTIEHGDGLSNFESNDDVEYDLSIDDSSSSEKGSVGKSKIRVFDQNLYENVFNVKEGSKIVLKGNSFFSPFRVQFLESLYHFVRSCEKSPAMAKSSFKMEHPLERRQAEAARIREKYPDRIPVIVERAEKSEIADIDKKKYLVPADLTVGQFVYVVRKRIKLSPEKAIFIFIKNILPPTAAMMSAIYEENKDEDGFLYMTYSVMLCGSGCYWSLPVMLYADSICRVGLTLALFKLGLASKKLEI
ncbi:hypothetical protein F0562_011060 [Nyssa sinensis]|uniref:Autophagy-related protein n=1 Tax=Nyssa sinensis TaxID=561372 RepID=A0A5J5A5L9_9ASTE|nr:hypothetical protein F0562_011060 [Nyssa sinensis]